MDHQPRNPDFEARVRGSFARQNAMGLIGARLTRVEPGRVEIELPVREDLLAGQEWLDDHALAVRDQANPPTGDGDGFHEIARRGPAVYRPKNAKCELRGSRRA